MQRRNRQALVAVRQVLKKRFPEKPLTDTAKSLVMHLLLTHRKKPDPDMLDILRRLPQLLRSSRFSNDQIWCWLHEPQFVELTARVCHPQDFFVTSFTECELTCPTDGDECRFCHERCVKLDAVTSTRMSTQKTGTFRPKCTNPSCGRYQ